MQLSRGSDKHVGAMVLRGTAWLLGGRFARMAVGLLGVAILARLLTPEDFGLFAVAFMVLPLAIAVLDGLIDVPVIREDSLSRLDLANLIWASVALMAAVACGLWLSAPWLAAVMNLPDLAPVLRVSCFAILLQPFISASYALLRRQHRYAEVGGYVLLSGIVHAAVSIALALAGCGIWSLVGGQLASLGTTTVAGSISAGIPILPPMQMRMLGAWRMGGLGFSSRLLAWLTANIDTMFAVSALGAADAGIYSRAYNITTQLKEPFAAIDSVVRQAFVAQRNLDDAVAARATLGGLRMVVLAAALVSAAVIAMREAVVALFLGGQWTAVVVPLSILASSLPARVARVYLDGFTYARGSILHLTGRNLMIVLLMAGGLMLGASSGVVVIASVVAAGHYATLAFPGGPSDRLLAGSFFQRLVAAIPGYGIGAALIGASEGLSILADVSPGIMDWTLRAGVCAAVFAATAVFLPDAWLPAGIRARRATFRWFKGTTLQRVAKDAFQTATPPTKGSQA